MSTYGDPPVSPVPLDPAAAARERRQRVLKKGVISYANRSITVDVVVRDLSSAGAKLKIVQAAPVPDHFTLEIPMDGVMVDCEVRWRNGDTLGVAFTSHAHIDEKKQRQRIDPTGYGERRPSVLRRPTY